MKKLFFLFSMLMLLTISTNSVWGAEATYSMTPDKTTTGSSATSYITTLTEFTCDGIKWKMNQWNPSSLQVKTNQSSAANEFRFYNTTAFSGKITKVVVKFSALTLSSTTTTGFKFVGGTSEVSSTTGGTDGTWNSTDKTLTWTPGTSDNFTYFAMFQNGKVATGTNKLATSDAIVVTYETSGGGNTLLPPTFSPTAGTYEGTQNVTITSTEGATIYYTTDGSTPTINSNVYSSAITVNADMTIKAYAVKSGLTDSEIATAEYIITEGPDLLLDFTDNTDWNFPLGNTNKIVEERIYSKDGYSIKVAGSTGNGYYFNDGKLLLGKTGAYITLPTFEYPVEKIVCPGVSGASGKVTWNVYDGTEPASTAATGCTTTQTFIIDNPEANKPYTIRIINDNNLQISHVKIYLGEAASVAKPTISGETSFLTSTDVSLSCSSEGSVIYYTTDGSDPKEGAEYSAPFSLASSATVKTIAKVGNDWSDVAEKTFTKATIMTVAEAKAAIDAAGSTPIENQYVAGIISQIDSYNSTYHSIQYWISADGTTTNQLEVYSGKGLNGADFAGLSDLSLGDEVIVKGTLKKYNSTYEFDMNSQIIQLNRTIAAPTFTPNGGGFLTTLNVSLASATEGAEVRYTTDGSDPISTSTLYENPIELSSTTTIKAAAFKGEFVSVIVTKTFTKGTKITVSAALDALNSSSPIENQFVYGKISTAPTSNPNSGRLTYKISDDGTTTNQLEVYNGFGLNGASFANKTDLQVGDEVTVYGTLKIYNEVKEFDAGNYLLEFNHPEVQTYSITYEENGGAEVADVAEATNLPDPLPSTTKDGKAFGGWFTDAEFNTPAEAGAALTSNVTLYAKWNDVSAWAAVYTSNVTLSTEGGTNASAAKVKLTSDGTEYDALKAGTSSKSGAVVVTVPDGATKLHFHAYGWSGESVTLSVTAPDGVTVSPSSVNIAANTGVSSNSPFTLEEGSAPQSEAYFAVTLSGNTDETALTFTATSGKRFVLFGVNQEGGAIPASIAVNPTSLAFGSVEQDAEVEAKTINVTLTEVAAATVALTGDGASAFNIDKSSLTASGVITVTPNTTNVGTYSATITISDNASAVDPVEVNVSMTVTEPMVADDLSGTWTLVTDASQLVAGKKVIIASVPDNGAAITMSTTQANNNRPGVSGATIAENAIAAQSGTAVFTIETGTKENTIAFKSSANEYLCAASSSKNYLHSQTENDDNGSWTISITDGVATITAQGTYSRNVMRYNPNNGSPIFACYASDSETGTLIELFVLQEDEPVEPDYTEIRTGLTAGSWGTFCYNQDVEHPTGASFFTIAYVGMENGVPYKVFFDEIGEGESLQAGQPYVYIANDDAIKGVPSGEAVTEGINDHGFIGVLSDFPFQVSDAASQNKYYVIYENQIRLCGDGWFKLLAGRAYINVKDPNLLTQETAAPAPGRRRISLSNPQAPQTATGIDAIESNGKTVKVMIGEQLFILRDGKLYDTTGRLVK